MRALIVVSLSVLCGVAHAAQQTVAVMPFKDLSGGKGSIGEAIRETVTTDLKDVRGLTVIERSAIDRVLSEQALQAQRTDLDPTSTVKVGKLLGASLVVSGAYQRSKATIRLTARFVRVETGEIVGTAKVDGAEASFLQLQDRVTAELLRSTGFDAGLVRKVTQRARPKLRGMRSIELYGDAVTEVDDQRRSEILRSAVDADPGFVYAAKDLAALEQRMRGYAATANVAQEQAGRELRAQIKAEQDPQKRALLQIQALGALVSSRRYRQLANEARAILQEPVPPPPAGGARLDEVAGFYLLTAEGALKETDALLRDGEAFMKRFPASIYFKPVESILQRAITDRRKEEEGASKASAEVGALSSDDRWDLCRIGRIYEQASQHREAQRLFRACVQAGVAHREDALRALIQADIECADWPAARRDLQLFDAIKSEHAGQLRQMLENQIPTDG